jgi:hypothetical protein
MQQTTRLPVEMGSDEVALEESLDGMAVHGLPG